jgi:hypothetical protein
MGILDKIKGWLFGKHKEKEMKASPEPPMQQHETIIYEEEEQALPGIDEYVEIEASKPSKNSSKPKEIEDYVKDELTQPAKGFHAKNPMEGTTMVKKKTTKKKTAKKKVTKKKATKKKPTKKKVTKKKPTKKAAAKKKTTKKAAAKKTTKKAAAKKKIKKKK